MIDNMELKLQSLNLYRKFLFFVFLFLFIGIFLCSCNKTEKELNDLYSSGVVLVQNSGYYELKIDDELSVYFSGYSENGELENFTFDKDSIIVSTSYGTGFFISELGEIVTNHHVVGSTVSEKDASKSLKKSFKAIKDACSSAFDEANNKIAELNEALEDFLRGVDVDNLTNEEYTICKKAVEYRESLTEEKEMCRLIYNAIDDIDMTDAELSYINEVSIAYNDEYVTSSTDFVKCVVKKTDPENDLAIIQLSDKKTPADKSIIEIPFEDPMQTSSMFYPGKNDKLIMIGFNLGPALALTEEGVLSQCTSGIVSQERDNCYMYSIPSLHGSSGAPVLNQKGELVAVNFAGLSTTQNFNYGIKVEYLTELYY